jgi:hypothetical protein
MRRDIEQIRTPLETAFGVRDDFLQGERKQLAVPRELARVLAGRFRAIPQKLAGRIDVRWESWSSDNVLLGTVQRPHRVQPFTLILRSLGGYPIIRCISPVGVLDPGDNPGRITEAAESEAMRICALPNEHTGSYDLTIEDDVLLGDERHDADRVERLLRRVTTQADRLEEILLGVDQPMARFREDLRREGDG